MRTRIVEWIGHQSLFSDPRVDHALLTGKLRPDALRLLRVAASRRIVRVDGHTGRALEPGDANLPGFRQRYQWGPGGRDKQGRPLPGFIQEMHESDARILFASPTVASEFRDVTDGATIHPDGSITLDDPDRVAFASRGAVELALPQTGIDFSMVRTRKMATVAELDESLYGSGQYG